MHKATSAAAIRHSAEELVALSHGIHGRPETAFEEVYAAGRVADALEGHGFKVERGLGNLPTAVRATIGAGSMQVVICAEYDALPEIGHACGHNLIAAISVGAALGLATSVDDLDMELVLLGTPAEERGGGKIRLLDAGAFDDAAMAVMVHPAPYNIATPPVLALHWMDVTYSGTPAHASAFPELGINAADAAVVAQIAIGLARQHMIPSTRVHGIVTHAGTAANVVPDFSRLEYMIRAPHLDELRPARERVMRCFEAGATATGAALSIMEDRPTYAHLEHDPVLSDLYRHNAEELGLVFHDKPIPPVSTDMGNVSLKVPTIHPFLGINCLPAVNHQREFAAATVTSHADKAIVDGATALSWTVIDVAQNERVRTAIEDRKKRLSERIAG